MHAQRPKPEGSTTPLPGPWVQSMPPRSAQLISGNHAPGEALMRVAVAKIKSTPP